MNKKRYHIIAANQISQIETLYLGGYQQKIMLDGRYQSNPLLVFLHGGPGAPFPIGVSARGLYQEYSQHFITIAWDQLGCGINQYPVDDTFTIESYVDMTVDLLAALRKKFPEHPLIIQAASWGSVLAAKAVVKRPDLADAAVIYGQVISNMYLNEEVFTTLERVKIPLKEKKRVMAMRHQNDCTLQELMLIITAIAKYTDGNQCKAGGTLPVWPLLKGFLGSPDYTWKEIWATLHSDFDKKCSIWKELIHNDLSDTLLKVQIPYRILQGETDIITSTKAVSTFVSESDNKNLSLRIIPQNGHQPGPKGMTELNKEIIKMKQYLHKL